MPDSRNIGIPDSYGVSPRKQGKSYIFAVGINKYEYHPTLSNCVNDAKTLINTLTKKYQFNDVNEECIFLIDSYATKSSILDGLDRLIKKLNPEDDLIIYFGCHGYYKSENRTGYLVPYDGKYGIKKPYKL